MSAMTIELAIELFKENNGWFGSPALLTVEPRLITRPNREQVFDGCTRLAALSLMPGLLPDLWLAGKLPHHVFGYSQRTADQRKLLPRLLALAGHYDRAYQFTPEQWRETTADIRAYLQVPWADALAVFSQRHRQRKSYVKATHRSDPVMCNRRLVRQVRQLILTADETGQQLDIEAIRKVVFSDSTTSNRRTSDRTTSFHNDASLVDEDSRDHTPT